jgi:hypothetical protein
MDGSSESGGPTGADASSGGASDSRTPDAGGCPAHTAFVAGVKITLAVTWPGQLAGAAGSGTVHIWLRAQNTVSGTAVTSVIQTCESSLPDIPLSGAGQIVTGGSKVQIEIPNAVWDQPTMPKFNATGTQGGWDPGSPVTTNSTVGLVGLKQTASWVTPSTAWPSSFSGFSPSDLSDDDGDGKPGITAVATKGNGYVLPPTSLGAFGSAPSADKLYIVSRNAFSLSGTMTSCDTESGTAQVPLFENHVVGCHVSNGSDCTNGGAGSQADFVDQSRTVYQVGMATYEGKRLADNATCADVRSALP